MTEVLLKNVFADDKNLVDVEVDEEDDMEDV